MAKDPAGAAKPPIRPVGGNTGDSSNHPQKKRPRRKRRILEWTAIVLGILGIVVGIITVAFDRKIHKIAEGIDSTAGSINSTAASIKRDTQEIKDSVQTRPAGEFPNELEAIIKRIQKTCATLYIMTDTPGYGIYSAYNKFYEYKESLKKLARGIYRSNCGPHDQRLNAKLDIRLLVFTAKMRSDMNVHEQFTKDVFFRKLHESPEERDKLQTFYENYAYILPKREANSAAFLDQLLAGKQSAYSEFLQMLRGAESRTEDEFRDAGITVQETTHRYSLYLWVQDDESAVFAFQYMSDSPHNPSATAVAFQTEDTRLAKGLAYLFKEEWRRSTSKVPE